MTPARFRWGMILILVGLLVLLAQLDFLIAVGIEKIFTRSKLEAISYLTTVALFAGGLWLAFEGSDKGPRSSFFSSFTYTEDIQPGLQEIYALLDVGDADLTIRDATDELVYSRFAEFTQKPRIEYEAENGRAVLKFKNRDRDIWGGVVHVEDNEISDWTVKFNEDLPLTLDCVANTADIHLNMSTTPLRKLNVDAPDTYVYIKIGSMLPLVDVGIFGTDADVKVRVPRDAGIQVMGVDFDNYLERLGFVRWENAFVNQGYDTLEHKIVLDVDEKLKSFSIDTY